MGGRCPFTRYVGLGHRPFYDRPHRFTGDAVKYICKGLLGHLGNGSDLTSIHRNIEEIWRRRNVVVPHAVVHKLEMPYLLARARIKSDEALSKEIVPGAMSTVGVIRGRLGRYIHIAELLIRRHRCPRPRMARVSPGIILPGVVSELTCPRNSMKDPHALARMYVIPSHEAGGKLPRRGRILQRGTHDYDVPHD